MKADKTLPAERSWRAQKLFNDTSLRAWFRGFRVYGLGFRVEGLGIRPGLRGVSLHDDPPGRMLYVHHPSHSDSSVQKRLTSFPLYINVMAPQKARAIEQK